MDGAGVTCDVIGVLMYVVAIETGVNCSGIYVVVVGASVGYRGAATSSCLPQSYTGSESSGDGTQHSIR